MSIHALDYDAPAESDLKAGVSRDNVAQDGGGVQPEWV